MKSGLEGRNNELPEPGLADGLLVSMKSGLEGRNNKWAELEGNHDRTVSMKSGLEGRNNLDAVTGVSPSQVRSQ